MSKYLALLLFVAGSLAATKTASAQQLGSQVNPFALQNYKSGLCLGVNGNSTSPDAALIIWPCNGGESQQWYQGNQTADGSIGGYPAFLLQNNSCNNPRGCAALVAGVAGGNMTDGTQVITWSEDPTNFGIAGATDNQGWAMEPVLFNNGNECYQLVNAGTRTGTPFNLGVQNGSTAQASLAVIWQDQSTFNLSATNPDQIWCTVY